MDERDDEADGVTPAAMPTPGDVAAALPGLARIAASTWLNAAQWSLLTSARTSKRLLAATRDPAIAHELAAELGVTVGTVTDVARAVVGGVPLPTALAAASEVEAQQAASPEDGLSSSLRERGAGLLARSRDVWEDDEEHPAYARILDDLAPDEARVLMLLLRSGPQPSVDVRTGGPVGRMHSELIAPGLTMIGARAGCRYVERVPAYLNNLHRLGLVWFSREQLTDPMEYQVLEAQPDVLEALHAQRFTKVVRRSIHLTPFGDDFCRAVLLSADDATTYPHHDPPAEPVE
ncbi:MAG: Abi-alpha family protein [Nocardioides sp.]